MLELLVAVVIISVGVLGFIGSFQYLSEAISNSRSRTIATSLAEQQQEYLKTVSYFLLVVTTAPVYSTESGVASFPYDNSYYPSQQTVVGGNVFTVRTYVQKVQQSGGSFAPIDPLLPDTGMKQITIYVMWQPGGAGGYWMTQVTSFSTNPNLVALSSTIMGTITNSSGTALSGAVITCLQDSSFYGASGSNGGYSYGVSAGSYTLRASLYGYYTGYSSTFYLASNSTATENISLTAISTGTADGYVWISTNLVISQVVASSQSPAGLHQEWVELFNPTTSTIVMSEAGTPQYTLYYYDPVALSAEALTLVYKSTSVASDHYFLIANTNTITAAGITRNADAYYQNPSAGTDCLGSPQTCIPAGVASGVGIQNSEGQWVDSLAWGGVLAPAEFTEGTATTTDLGVGDQFIRMSSTGTSTAGFGPCYQTYNNSINFLYTHSALHLQHHSSVDSAVPIAGVPAVGAVVTTNDGLSQPTTAQSKVVGSYPYAEFTLPSIGTGTYTLAISSGVYYQEISSVTITAGATTYVPNASTTPIWPSTSAPYNVFLSSMSSNGYVTGYVWNATGLPLSAHTVASGGNTATTASDGSYILSIPAGVYTVTANPTAGPNYDANYVSLDSTSVNVVAGELTTDVDYYLSQGGNVSGWISTNGTDALPNVNVIAVNASGNTLGSAVSGSNGYFTIANLSTGTYTISPQLDVSESVTPSSPSVTVSLGATTFSSTFTVSGAFGTISGTLYNNSLPIQTGVLLMATTATITGTPPTDNSTFRSGGALYYAASSISNGTYQLPVRGSSSAGTVYNVYAWYTTWNGSVPTTSVKSSTAAMTEGGSSTLNFTWP
jgi:hypothetical protein